MIQIAKIKKALRSTVIRVVGWCGDEMDIQAGLEYLEHLGCIVGLVDGPIAEKDIEKMDEKAIPKMLATKIMMIHLVTIDGKASIPVGFFATNGATAVWLKDLVCCL